MLSLKLLSNAPLRAPISSADDARMIAPSIAPSANVPDGNALPLNGESVQPQSSQNVVAPPPRDATSGLPFDVALCLDLNSRASVKYIAPPSKSKRRPIRATITSKTVHPVEHCDSWNSRVFSCDRELRTFGALTEALCQVWMHAEKEKLRRKGCLHHDQTASEPSDVTFLWDQIYQTSGASLNEVQVPPMIRRALKNRSAAALIVWVRGVPTRMDKALHADAVAYVGNDNRVVLPYIPPPLQLPIPMWYRGVPSCRATLVAVARKAVAPLPSKKDVDTECTKFQWKFHFLFDGRCAPLHNTVTAMRQWIIDQHPELRQLQLLEEDESSVHQSRTVWDETTRLVTELPLSDSVLHGPSATARLLSLEDLKVFGCFGRFPQTETVELDSSQQQSNRKGPQLLPHQKRRRLEYQAVTSQIIRNVNSLLESNAEINDVDAQLSTLHAALMTAGREYSSCFQ